MCTTKLPDLHLGAGAVGRSHTWDLRKAQGLAVLASAQQQGPQAVLDQLGLKSPQESQLASWAVQGPWAQQEAEGPPAHQAFET